MPIWNIKWDTNWEIHFTYQLKIHFDQIPIEILICEILKFEIWNGGGAVRTVWSFCFGLNTFSPFGINRQKRRPWEP
jgi:hypothetical protein